MLSADEQEHISRANREAFEQLARSWRNPQTRENEPELKPAIISMLTEYFATGGCGHAELQSWASNLCSWLGATDERREIEPTEEISDAARTRLTVEVL